MVIVWYVGNNDLQEYVSHPSMADVVCYLETLIPIYLTTVCHNLDHITNKQVM
jgi:hypothetical protein